MNSCLRPSPPPNQRFSMYFPPLSRSVRALFPSALLGYGLILFFPTPLLFGAHPPASRHVFPTSHQGDSTGEHASYGVYFYNVENLFDTLDDAHFLDEEFTPHGARKYGSIPYRLRIRQLARALRMAVTAAGARPLALVLAEVENHGVLLDLSQHPALRLPGTRWEAISFDSPDKRGIDCAVLVNTEAATPLDQDLVRYSNDSLKTRDALLVDLLLLHDSTKVRLIGVHLSSKLGGARRSEGKRRYELNAVNQALLERRERAPTNYEILLGDFNENRSNEAYQDALANGWREPLWQKMPKGVQGTYKYQGRWDQIDWALYRGKGVPTAQVLAPAPLLTDDTKWGGKKPARAWQGLFFTNGYSDHLPICLTLPFGLISNFPSKDPTSTHPHNEF